MGRPVRVAAPPTAEADILRAILDYAPLNTILYRNTRGGYRDNQGKFIRYGIGPNGASDVIGLRVIRVTPEMVGARLAQFVAIEAKRDGAGATDEQQAFIDNILAAGGCAGVCRSGQDAAALLLDVEALKRKGAR